jgi:hypothetical protein
MGFGLGGLCRGSQVRHIRDAPDWPKRLAVLGEHINGRKVRKRTPMDNKFNYFGIPANRRKEDPLELHLNYWFILVVRIEDYVIGKKTAIRKLWI